MLVKYNNSLLKVSNNLVKIDKSVELGLVYETDFSNLDFNTYIDIPLYGKPAQWTKTNGPCNLKTITVDGVSYNCLFINGSNLLLNNQSDFVNLEEDIVTFETTTYKESFTSLGGGAGCNCNCPMYNCYTGNRGLGIMLFGNYSNVITYNGYYNLHDTYYYSNKATEKNIYQIAVGGMTINKKTKELKCYLNGKKCVKFKQNDIGNSKYRIYGDNMGGNYQMNYCILKVKIYKGIDKFEMME